MVIGFGAQWKRDFHAEQQRPGPAIMSFSITQRRNVRKLCVFEVEKSLHGYGVPGQLGKFMMVVLSDVCSNFL
jgi:hypothetical protein